MNFENVFKLVLLLICFACNGIKNDKAEDVSVVVSDSANIKKTIRDIEPSLWKADSLQIIYYDNPDGDSLRYTRFFSFTKTGDSIKVNSLLEELNQSFEEEQKNRDCRSEGKLFLLNKEDILKTIFFSTRGDSCSYMYFIKDGSFIYFSLSEKAKQFFSKDKKLARKPR
jgi:hypothetical protein